MKQSLQRIALGFLALAAAVAVGFLSGYLVSRGSLSANRHPTASNQPTSAFKSEPEKEKEPAPSPESSPSGPIRIDPSEAYSSKRPSLMALTLAESMDKVVARYGNPVRQYDVQEDSLSVTIFEYAGFAVGFQDDRVLFVEIRDVATDPGLNGLRLGNHRQDAERALGKPDTDTGYVMAYKTKSTILKLDVDPQNKTIQSIKLFGRLDA